MFSFCFHGPLQNNQSFFKVWMIYFFLSVNPNWCSLSFLDVCFVSLFSEILFSRYFQIFLLSCSLPLSSPEISGTLLLDCLILSSRFWMPSYVFVYPVLPLFNLDSFCWPKFRFSDLFWKLCQDYWGVLARHSFSVLCFFFKIFN